jgi:hypothetical protein
VVKEVPDLPLHGQLVELAGVICAFHPRLDGHVVIVVLVVVVVLLLFVVLLVGGGDTVTQRVKGDGAFVAFGGFGGSNLLGGF